MLLIEAAFDFISCRFFRSSPLDPFAPPPVDAQPFSVFISEGRIVVGEITLSICARENLDELLNTLVQRNKMSRYIWNALVAAVLQQSTL